MLSSVRPPDKPRISMELVKNKKATFDYEILETFHAGLMLEGHEVKSIRLKQVNLRGSHVSFSNGEAWVNHMNITPYQPKNDPEKKLNSGLRKRKLLLNKKEIAKLIAHTETPGVSVIPLKLILEKNKIKLVIGVGRGKKKFDKRESIKKRSLDRQLKKSFKLR